MIPYIKEEVMKVIYKPYEYQEYCTQRVINDNAVGLFLDMGLG